MSGCCVLPVQRHTFGSGASIACSDNRTMYHSPDAHSVTLGNSHNHSQSQHTWTKMEKKSFVSMNPASKL